MLLCVCMHVIRQSLRIFLMRPSCRTRMTLVRVCLCVRACRCVLQNTPTYMMYKQKNECNEELLICVCMRTHTLMNTVTPPRLSAVLMYIDVFFCCCNHLPIYPSISTRQHSYTRTRGHLLRCTRARTHTCGPSVFPRSEMFQRSKEVMVCIIEPREEPSQGCSMCSTQRVMPAG